MDTGSWCSYANSHLHPDCAGSVDVANDNLRRIYGEGRTC